MRISVDAEQCNGHGRCYTVSPEVYAPDDEGYCADRGRSREIAARARGRRPGRRASVPGGRDNDHVG